MPEELNTASSVGSGDNGGDGSPVVMTSVGNGVLAIVAVAGCMSYGEGPVVPACVGGKASTSDLVLETLGRVVGPSVGEVGERSWVVAESV